MRVRARVRLRIRLRLMARVRVRVWVRRLQGEARAALGDSAGRAAVDRDHVDLQAEGLA